MASNILFVARMIISVALTCPGGHLLMASETSPLGKTQPAQRPGEDSTRAEKAQATKSAEISEAPAPLQVEVDSKFIEATDTALLRLPARGDAVEFLRAAVRDGSDEAVLSDAETGELHTALSSARGIDFLSAPRVTTKSGQRAVIEIIREFRYPTAWERDTEKQLWLPTAFETRNCGVTLEIEPLVTADGAISLRLVAQIVEFLGYRDLDTGKAFPNRGTGTVGLARRHMISKVPAQTPHGTHRLQPVFSARKRETTVILQHSEAALLASLPETEEVTPFKSPAKSRRLIVTIAARVIDTAARSAPLQTEKSPARMGPQSSSATAPATLVAATPARASTILSAVVRAGDKPGFVRSPHALESGVIDVRGFPPGTEVKCPYSGKVFLVP